jgi:predicted DCC family thiol-disulfide oxidoreductase YuxK
VDRDRPYTLIYDGSCKVCRKFVSLLQTWDRRLVLELVPFQQTDIPRRFPWIRDSDFTSSMQLVRNSDGKTWQGAQAVEHILAVLPRGRLVSWMFSIPFARPLAEKLYRWFARNRYHLGCDQHCRPRGEGGNGRG